MPTTKSPLRYPGGKTQLWRFVNSLIELNQIERAIYCEPYAGGAGVAIQLLLDNLVEEIIINDYDPAIYNFWRAIILNTNDFISLIESTEVTIESWNLQKSTYDECGRIIGSLEGAFSTFFLNRTNVSGIISGGPIGGKEQNGKYKIDCRFNKSDLISKIEGIAKQRSRIHLFNEDAVRLVDIIKRGFPKERIFIFFDPPYYVQGKSLYLSSYNHEQHAEMRDAVLSMEDYFWILTYDKTKQISELYVENDKTYEYALKYSANEKRVAKELLFASPVTQVKSEECVELSAVS